MSAPLTLSSVAILGLGAAPLLAAAENLRRPEAWVALACALVTGLCTVVASRHSGRIKTLEASDAACKKELADTRRELRARDEKDRSELESRIVALEAKVPK
jgi:hypothetical protein